MEKQAKPFENRSNHLLSAVLVLLIIVYTAAVYRSLPDRLNLDPAVKAIISAALFLLLNRPHVDRIRSSYSGRHQTRVVVNTMAFLLLLWPLFYFLVVKPTASGADAITSSLSYVFYVVVLMSFFSKRYELFDFVECIENKTLGRFLLPALACIYVLYYVYPTLSCDYVMSADSITHFSVARHFALYGMPQAKYFDWFDFQGGMPLLLTYPPIPFYLYGILYNLASGMVSANYLWTIYQLFVVLGITLSTQYLMRVLGFTRLESFFSSLFVVTWRLDALKDFSPFVLYTYFGMLPQVLSYIPSAIFFAVFFRLMKNPTTKAKIAAGFSFAVLILTHTYIALVAATVAFSYAVLISAVERDYRRRFTAIVHVGIVVCILTAFFTVPYLVNRRYFILSEGTLARGPTVNSMNSFYEDQWDMKVDGRIPYLKLFGLIGLVSLYSRRSRDGKLFLAALSLAPLLFSLTNYHLLINSQLEQTHLFGRNMFFFKMGWILLGVVGIYEFAGHIRRLVEKPYLFALLLMIAVLADQMWVNSIYPEKFFCFAEEALPGFGSPQGNVTDVLRIKEIVGRRGYGRFMIARQDNLLLLNPLTEYGIYVDLGTDRFYVRDRHPSYLLYDFLKSGDPGRLALLANGLGVKYVVYSTSNSSDDFPSYEKLRASNMTETLYHNQLALLEIKGVRPIEVPKNTVAIVDDRAFWRDIERHKMLIKNGVVGYDVAYVLLRSDEFDSKAADSFDAFVIGDVGCDVRSLKGFEESLRAVAGRGKRVYLFDEKATCDLHLADIVDAASLDGNLSRVPPLLPPTTEGTATVLTRGEYERTILVESQQDIAPVVIKDNNYSNWVVTQDGKPLRVYLSLPNNMLVMAKPGNEILVEYTTPLHETLAFAVSSLAALIFAYYYIKVGG